TVEQITTRRIVYPFDELTISTTTTYDNATGEARAHNEMPEVGIRGDSVSQSTSLGPKRMKFESRTRYTARDRATLKQFRAKMNSVVEQDFGKMVAFTNQWIKNKGL